MAIEESEKQLAGYALRKYLATFDEQATPKSGKLAVDIDGEVDSVELDFLFRIDGPGPLRPGLPREILRRAT